ncbi:putative MOLO1 domain-containing protein, partial [Cardiosporidium cionae]
MLLPSEPPPDELELEALADRGNGYSVSTPQKNYTLESYPAPLLQPTACNRRGLEASYVCDPEHIFTRTQADQIEEYLVNFRGSSFHFCKGFGYMPYMSVRYALVKDILSCMLSSTTILCSLAVALLSHLPENISAEIMAMELLERWGLGHKQASTLHKIILHSLCDVWKLVENFTATHIFVVSR